MLNLIDLPKDILLVAMPSIELKDQPATGSIDIATTGIIIRMMSLLRWKDVKDIITNVKMVST